jgi:PadR family transcriptional regulator PadR
LTEGNEIRSLLRPFLLLLVHERPGHGYELIERLGALGVPGVEPGHAYRVLRDLERAGLLRSAWEPSGASELAEWVRRLEGLSRVLRSCVERWTRASSRTGELAGRAR